MKVGTKAKIVGGLYAGCVGVVTHTSPCPDTKCTGEMARVGLGYSKKAAKIRQFLKNECTGVTICTTSLMKVQ